jgi:hypothetical protein
LFSLKGKTVNRKDFTTIVITANYKLYLLSFFMAQARTKHTATVREKEVVVNRTAASGIFSRDNLLWMIGGAVVMIIGYMLMSGGRSDDPNVFNANEVYSARRITVAPILILLGLAIEVYALFRTPKRS